MFKGNPSDGVICQIYDKKTNTEIKKFFSVLLEKQVKEAAKMFEYMNRRTYDPEERYSKAVKLFSSEYFNTPENFDGRFTATFTKNDKFVNDLKLNIPEIVYIYSQNSAKSFLNIIKKYGLIDLWMDTNLMCLGEKSSAVLNEIKWKKIFLFNPGEEEYLLYKI